jgi:hypothetical protein
MKPYFLLLGGFICAAAPGLFASGIDASATFTDTLISPGEYQYNLTLDNIGTTTIGTFWFSWIPGDNFMPVNPTSIDSPTGWQELVTTGGPSDGFAIQWTAKTSASDLAEGNSLSGFSFDSSLTPAELESPASGNPSDPVTTAFVYNQAPFSDAGFQLTVQPATATPEPTTILSTAFGFGLIVLSRSLLRRRRKLGQDDSRMRSAVTCSTADNL